MSQAKANALNDLDFAALLVSRVCHDLVSPVGAVVNGLEVPAVRPDGTFSYFSPSLPAGENLITITAQNSKGGVKTLQKKVVIQ